MTSSPYKKGRPVFLTQSNHRRWALKGVARGYAACIYPGADVNDQSVPFRTAYGNNATWGTIFARAWLAMRSLDYLETVDGIDASRSSISGHSRNGKQAMLAAAFDDRVSAVVSSSSGSPGMCPYRTTSAFTFAEGPGDAPSDWWTWQLSCFKGREHKLPIDSHGLLGLIAPRPMLAATAWTDGCEPTWAVERSYKAGREVYRFLNADNNLRIKYRPGQHHGYLDVDSYFDWFDVAHGRVGFDENMFPELLVQDFDWAAWNAVQPASAKHSVPHPSAPAAEKISWGLGVEPSGAASPGGHYGEQCEDGPTANGCFVAEMMTHDRFTGRTVGIQRQDVNFGEYISASMYFPSNHSGNPLPVVIWLHPLSYDSGFNEGYIESESGTGIYFDIAAAGYAVIAFDGLGFGSRGYEFNGAAGGPQGQQPSKSGGGTLPLFYRRYPEWSLLGKLVHDARSAVDLATTGNGPLYPGHDPPIALPKLDERQVFAVGYNLGGMVGLYLAATDSRLAGVVSVNGFTPLRNDTNRGPAAAPTGGVRRLWDWHGLQPRLGWFDGIEEGIPYDFDDLMVAATTVDRPAANVTGGEHKAAAASILIYQQDYDRTADAAAVAACVAKAKAKGARVELITDPTVNLLNDKVHNAVIDWLRGHTNNSSAP